MSLPPKPAARKNETIFWDLLRGRIYSRKGGWVIGEAIYNQGYSMMDDLVGEVSYFQVLILNAVGRLPERRLADWLEAAFICLSWPDSRIWCNHIASLAGSSCASPVAAISAAILASDGHMYGPRTLVYSARFIREALNQKKADTSVAEIVKACCKRASSNPVIVGYARPIATGDERVVAMMRVSKKLGFEDGEFLKLAFEIEEFLKSNYGESMNICGYVSAFLSDYGFTPEEIYSLCSICVNSGAHACYTEAISAPPESFFPLRCEDIDYQGMPPRQVPPGQKIL